jgi:hypothetical protein
MVTVCPPCISDPLAGYLFGVALKLVVHAKIKNIRR